MEICKFKETGEFEHSVEQGYWPYSKSKLELNSKKSQNRVMQKIVCVYNLCFFFT